MLAELLEHRAFEFAVERAVFVATLHRLFVSGSDRDCSSWMADYDIAVVDGLDLHHFYRAMAWLGEELEEKRADALAPRCVKDVIEERLFDQRRDLFTDLSAVFMDTTSLSFSGEGGETLGEHGYSKDYRPDLKQMILGLVVDGSGSPLCTEMWPGDTADVTTLIPVIDRLRQRFSIGRVCAVADRGMSTVLSRQFPSYRACRTRPGGRMVAGLAVILFPSPCESGRMRFLGDTLWPSTQ